MQVYNTWIVSVMQQNNKYRLQILVVGKDLSILFPYRPLRQYHSLLVCAHSSCMCFLLCFLSLVLNVSKHHHMLFDSNYHRCYHYTLFLVAIVVVTITIHWSLTATDLDVSAI